MGGWTRALATAWLAPLALALTPVLPARPGEPVVPYTIVNGRAIPESLTGAPGDPVRGRVLYADDPRTKCSACHARPGAPGNEAVPSVPDLSTVGARFDPGEIRLWLVAPAVLDEDTTMPAYYAAGQRTGADDPLYGGPRLTAAEIEDLVAYLAELGKTD